MKKHRRPLSTRSAVTIGLAFTIALVSGSPADQRDVASPSAASPATPNLRNVTLSKMKDLKDRPAKLKNGSFEGDHLSVRLLEAATADLNRDGAIDGVAVVVSNSGGSGNFRELCLLLGNGRKLRHVDTACIGDRIKVTKLEIAEGIVEVDYLDRATEESYAVAPHIQKRVRYHVRGGRLVKLPTAERPNMLVILVDDMGYSDLGCFGSEILTPHLDKLASDGIRYTGMRNTAKCYPTRLCLMTGCYFQSSNREWENTITAAEVLGPAGYDTAWFGKHHAVFNPTTRGFDKFGGFLGGAVNFWNPGTQTEDGKPVPGIRYDWIVDDKLVNPFIPEEGFHCTDAFTDWSLAWLKQDERASTPWFLYLAYNAPHWPLHAHPEDIDKFRETYREGYVPIQKARLEKIEKLGLSSGNVELAAFDEEELSSKWSALDDEGRSQESLRMAIHAAMVHQVDRSIGRLVEQLNCMGQLENTLIVFLADNGASSERARRGDPDPNAPWGSEMSFECIGREWSRVANSPRRGWKGMSYDGGINTCMIAHWPKGITKPGTINRDPCHLIDMMPTWMEMTGAKVPAELNGQSTPQLQGVSLVPSFHGKPIERSTALYFQFGRGRAVLDGKWKVVSQTKDHWELYNIEADPQEQVDLTQEYPEKKTRMVAAWDSWYKEQTGAAYTGAKSKKEKKPQKDKK